MENKYERKFHASGRVIFPPVKHLCPVHNLLGLTDDGHGIHVQVELVGGEAPAGVLVRL